MTRNSEYFVDDTNTKVTIQQQMYPLVGQSGTSYRDSATSGVNVKFDTPFGIVPKIILSPRSNAKVWVVSFSEDGFYWESDQDVVNIDWIAVKQT